MQEEPVHSMPQAQLPRPATAHPTNISQHYVEAPASSNTNTASASAADLDLLRPPSQKSERTTAREIPPPAYQKCVETLGGIVPTEGDLSRGPGPDFDPAVIMARLDRLEAQLNQIEAVVIASNKPTSSRRRLSLGRICEGVVLASLESMQRLCFRAAAYCALRSACGPRFEAYSLEVEAKGDDDPARRERLLAKAAEARREVERRKEAARYFLECVKDLTLYEESKVQELMGR